MTRSKPCYFPFNVIFFLLSAASHNCYSATLILSQSTMMKITKFCSLSFQSTLISLILVTFWFILPYSVVIPPRSGIFRYYSCLFRLIPVSFGFIPESFCLVPAYSALFVCHSGVIPVPFLFIASHSGVIPPHSGIPGLFRYIPFRSCV